jgi:hypothetical protein
MVSDTSGEFIGTTPAPPSGDRVELTDLEVIQRWSLAVRGATADRAEVVAALRADLAWLERGRSPRPASTPSAPRRTAPAKSAPAKKPVPQKAAAKKSTARTSTSRGGTRRR